MSPKNSKTTPTISRSSYVGLVVILASLISVGIALWKFQDIHDFIRLYGYKVPGQVEIIADKTTMTGKGRKLFYVNRPQILDAGSFSSQCPVGAEKTVVLGCYKSNDNGIFLFNVTDPRLEGVVEVTAAHETLHAAYMRLSDIERSKIDKLLTDYYENQLTDERIKETINAYKQTEPTAIVNEMHSIFGTEVKDLPSELETYYARYFDNRKGVVDLLAKYQSEFVGRQTRIEAYDSQLRTLKSQIEKNQSDIALKGGQIEREQSRMESLRDSGQNSTYNASVDPFNAMVSEYNNLIYRTRNEIASYNKLVESRNSIALEQQQLMQAMSSETVPHK